MACRTSSRRNGSWRSSRFDKVIAKDAKFAHAYFYRGLAYGKLDRKDKMLVDMDLFVDVRTDAPEAAIARLYLQR